MPHPVSGQSMTLPAYTESPSTEGTPAKGRPWRLIALRAAKPSSMLGWLVSLTCLSVPLLLLHSTQVGERFRDGLPELRSFESLLAHLNLFAVYVLPIGIILGVRWWYYYVLADWNYSLTQKLRTHDTLVCWPAAIILFSVGLSWPVRRFIHHNVFGLPLGDTIEAGDIFFSCLLFCGVFSYSMAVGAVLSDVEKSKGLPKRLRQSARWLLPACVFLELVGVFYPSSLATWITAGLPAVVLLILLLLMFSFARTEDIQQWWLVQLGLPLLLSFLMLVAGLLWGSSYNPFLSKAKEMLPGKWPVFLAWAIGYMVSEKTKATGAVEGVIRFIVRSNRSEGTA